MTSAAPQRRADAAGRHGFTAVDIAVTRALGVWYSAAVVRIEHRGRCAFERAWGTTHRFPRARMVDVDTAFDLASLTKVFVTAAALRAVDRGFVALDAPLAAVMPEWSQDERRTITLRMLLAHTSGLASGADYRKLFGSDVVAELLARPVVAPPATKVIYSDLGFIAAGVLLERLTGRPLAGALSMLLDGMPRERLAYRPFGDERAAIPATEVDVWRGMVQGRVHDEKAALMGGVSGHAGLFGTARDVAALCEVFLGPLRGRPSPVVGIESARAATTEQAWDPVLRRGLGWALRTTAENSCGARCSPHTFGHTGFTGTCAWSDPERDVTIVILTNAVHFGRTDLRAVRAAICDAAIDAIDEVAAE